MRSRIKTAAGTITVLGTLLVGVTTQHEGLRTRAYKDVIGVPTICVGETRGVKMGDVKSVEDCKWMLGDRLVEFEQKTLQNPKCIRNGDAIPDKTYVAMISIAYNIGEGGFCKSSMARHLNNGDYAAACESLMLYTRAGGVVWQGLVNRRKEERKLCLEGLR